MTPIRQDDPRRLLLAALALPALLITSSQAPTGSSPQPRGERIPGHAVEFLMVNETAPGEVTFQLPSRFVSGQDLLDWEQLAQDHFDEFDLNLLDPHKTSRTLHTAREHAIVRRLASESNLFGHTEVAYDAPLPNDLTRHAFFLVSPNGVHELRPTRLMGIVRFRSNVANTVIFDLTHYGYVAAKPLSDGPLPTGGFVVEGTQPIITHRPARAAVLRVVEARIEHARAETARRKRPRSPQDRPQENQRKRAGRELWHPIGWDYRPINSFTFRLRGTDEEYVFIQWAPDFCNVSFEISRRDEPNEILASGGYGCDI